jgi:hypothetical protein
MAQEDPDAIMCSIVFKPSYEYQYDDKEKRIDIFFCDKKGSWKRCTNELGEPNKYDRDKELYVQLDEFYFTDIVDQGAATDKLFSANFNKDKFSVIATEFLNSHPEIDSFLRDNPAKLTEFISKRKNNYSEQSEAPEDTNIPNNTMKIDMSKYPTFASLLGFGEAESTDAGLHLQESHLGLLETALLNGAGFETQVGTLTGERSALETQLSGEKGKVTSLTNEKTQLETKVTELEKAHVPAPGAAGNAADGPKGDGDGSTISAAEAELNEINKLLNS